MNKIKFLIVTIIFCIITIPVYADNTVDYKLTITKDYKFNEVINYEISDYKQKQNGYNPFVTIIEDDIYVDIMQKEKYQKIKTFKNGKYYVTLKHTFNEYSLSNSIFLNDCFENKDYNYDMEEIDFSSSDGFYCLKGDKLKITIITDFNVISTNANISGNKYIWNPVDDYFTMRINIAKEYANENENSTLPHGYDESSEDPLDDTKTTDDIDQKDDPFYTEDTKEEQKPNYTIIGIVAGAIIIAGLIVVIVLKNKKSNLNKI